MNRSRSEDCRAFFASLLVSNVGLKGRDGGLEAAFATVPRERFLGPGPWHIFTPSGYITTPSDDPAFIYQDVTVALTENLSTAAAINNGQPLLHAMCLSALAPKMGEIVIHVGAGTGYYTALLAELVGTHGKIHAYEIEADLAARARHNLADRANVTVALRSGAEEPLPSCDAIYINAGVTEVLDIWLDALRPDGRLLLPLTPAERPGGRPGIGGILLITRKMSGGFDARFVAPAAFIPCIGARNQQTANRLAEAFQRGNSQSVRSLQRGSSPDQTCWCEGNGWWLSTRAN